MSSDEDEAKSEVEHDSEEYREEAAESVMGLDTLSENETRPVMLLPGEKDDAITCSLEHIRAIENGNHKYEALSYMCGPPKSVAYIQLNGQRHMVRANLFAASKALRHEDRSRQIWIDAICINQKGMAERSSQVLATSGIYRSARKVLVWLGEGNGSASRLFRFQTFTEGCVKVKYGAIQAPDSDR